MSDSINTKVFPYVVQNSNPLVAPTPGQPYKPLLCDENGVLWVKQFGTGATVPTGPISDNMGTPATVGLSGSFNMVFDGVTWDFVYGSPLDNTALPTTGTAIRTASALYAWANSSERPMNGLQANSTTMDVSSTTYRVQTASQIFAYNISANLNQRVTSTQENQNAKSSSDYGMNTQATIFGPLKGSTGREAIQVFGGVSIDNGVRPGNILGGSVSTDRYILAMQQEVKGGYPEAGDPKLYWIPARTSRAYNTSGGAANLPAATTGGALNTTGVMHTLRGGANGKIYFDVHSLTAGAQIKLQILYTGFNLSAPVLLLETATITATGIYTLTIGPAFSDVANLSKKDIFPSSFILGLIYVAGSTPNSALVRAYFDGE